MSAIAALLVIAIVYAIGDFVSYKTKAVFSMLFVSGLLFLLGIWTFIPKTIFDDAQIFYLAIALVPMLMVHMGTLMKLVELKEEWKTVLLAFSALVAVAIILLTVGSLILDKQYALAAIGPISGGVVATLIIQEAANAQGLETIAVFVTMLLVLQSFIGLPIASFCLSREARKRIEAFRSNQSGEGEQAKAKSDPEKPLWQLIPRTPDALRTPFVLIMKAMLVGWLAVFVAGLLGDVINKYIMALVFGIIFYELGFLEHKILDKANSAGLALFALLVPVFHSLPNATPELVASLIVPIVTAFLLAIVGIIFMMFILGKVLGYPWTLSIPIGVSCLFGFPGTFIIAEEVSNAASENEQEKAHLMSVLLPKMLVAGFTTVTIGSVIITGIIVSYL